jgi:hypothetical protein
MAEVKVSVHDGSTVINQKITRSKLAIKILQIEYEIHDIEQEKGKVYQASITKKIELINRIAVLDTELLTELTPEKLEEIKKLTEIMNNSLDYEKLEELDSLITAKREEIDDIMGMYNYLDEEIRKRKTVNVYQAKIRTKGVEEE